MVLCKGGALDDVRMKQGWYGALALYGYVLDSAKPAATRAGRYSGNLD